MFIKLIQSRQMDHFIADILELKSSFLHFSVKINGWHYRVADAPERRGGHAALNKYLQTRKIFKDYTEQKY